VLVALTLAGLLILSTSTKATAREMLLLDPPDQTGHLDHLKWALALDEITDRDATLAVAWAGIIPYFADRSAVDLLGRCDATIAHEPMPLDPEGGFYPGHMKWDYDSIPSGSSNLTLSSSCFDRPRKKFRAISIRHTVTCRSTVN